MADPRTIGKWVGGSCPGRGGRLRYLAMGSIHPTERGCVGIGERMHRPAVTAWAVRTKFVVVLEQLGDAAEVDHTLSLAPEQIR